MYIAPATTAWDVQPYPKRTSRFPKGLHSSGFLGKTCQSGQCRPEQIERGTNRHNGWPIAGTFWAPIKGTLHPQALYLSPGYEVSFTPLCVDWHLAVWVFLIGIIRESRLKPPGQDLTGGGRRGEGERGGISLCLVL
jgi:hypothetical protein